MNMYSDTNMPDIFTYDDGNPTLTSPNCAFELPFYQTRETLLDVESYKNFLDNSISRFRHSKTYKHYKSFLMRLGMNRCQFHSNIVSSEEQDMATIEMHHNMLTIFDIALIITEHTLNTHGRICTFDLVDLLKTEHTNHRVQLVMLSLTPHQLCHNNPDFFIHPRMCFGNWYEFLERYKYGITQDIAFKILFYLKRAIENGSSNDAELLSIRDNILDWSGINERY